VSKAYRIYIPPLRTVVVNKDVRFEEDKAFQRSLELRVGVEDDAESSIAVLEGAQPQISNALVSGVRGSPCTASGS
jgi:hypothetical protein